MSETNQVTEQAPTTTASQAAPTAASTTTEGTQTTAAAPEAKQQQATDGQTGNTTLLGDEPTKTEGEEGKPKTEEVKGAPEKYEFKAPEGQDFDPEVIGAYSEIAKELNLPQEAAQKIIDKIAPVMAQKQERVLGEAVKAWTESSRADKEYGGEKFDENLGVAKKALSEFSTPELRKLLGNTNLQHHPEVLRLFYRVGKAISEDRIVTGKAGQSTEKSVAQRLFPNMNP